MIVRSPRLSDCRERERFAESLATVDRVDGDLVDHAALGRAARQNVAGDVAIVRDDEVQVVAVGLAEGTRSFGGVVASVVVPRPSGRSRWRAGMAAATL